MIIFFILLSVVVIGIVLLVLEVCDKLPYYDCADFVNGAIGIISIFSGLAVLGSSIAFICINSFPEVNLITWEEHVAYLENRKEMLQNVKPIVNPEGEIVGYTSSIYLHYDNPQEYYRDVDNYNNDVKEFVTDLKVGTYKRNNPFINWFISPAYTMFNQEQLQGLEITVKK